MNRIGFCIFIDTVCEGAVPAIRDADGEAYVFDSRLAAEHEIADNLITRLQEFIDGEREFDEAATFDEYVEEVEVRPDRSVKPIIQ